MTVPLLRLLARLALPLAMLLPSMAQAWTAAPVGGDMERRMKACTACHGLQGRAGTDAYYPRIAGKPEGYLYNQLRNFRDGRRQYVPMTWLLDQLPDAYLREIAAWFAAQHPPYPPPERVDVTPAVLERGRRLAVEGDASRNVPSCVSCHGAQLLGVAPAIPGLLGLPRDYINAQFGAWKNGSRRTPAPDCMGSIAQRLSVDDISAVSAWLAMQTPSGAAASGVVTPVQAVAAAQPVNLPMPCGSVPGSAP